MANNEEKKPIQSPRMIMLSNGQQVIAGIEVSDGSDFIRLSEPYKVRIHENAVDSETYFVEERMSLTPWMFQTVDKIYSIHKTHIFSIGVPNQNLVEYYNTCKNNSNISYLLGEQYINQINNISPEAPKVSMTHDSQPYES